MSFEKEIEASLKALERNNPIYIRILFWKVRDYTNAEIGKKFIQPNGLKYGEDWVKQRMGEIYSDLGFDPKMTRADREKILKDDYRPVLDKMTEGWKEEEYQVTRGEKKVYRPKPVVPKSIDQKTVDQEPVDPESVDYPEKTKEHPVEAVKTADPIPPPPPLTQFALKVFAMGIAIGGLLLTVLYFAFFRSIGAAPEPTATGETATLSPPTQRQEFIPEATFTATTTSTPTATSTPSLTPTITNTPTPSDTPGPTITPRPTEILAIREGRSVQIRNDVYLTLSPRFGNTSFVLCWYPDTGFTLVFEVVNSSGGDFRLGFEWFDFSVVDDLGNSYTIRASGIGECNDDPQPRIYNMRANADVTIYVNLVEDISLDASYLIVTVNEISNNGPFVFRKDF